MDRSIRQDPAASVFPQAFVVAAGIPRFRAADPVHARIGDGLAEMLAKMSRDHEEGSAKGGLTVEHFLRFVGIDVVEGIAENARRSPS